MWQQVRNALRESTHRALVKLASFLPGLLALLVAIFVLTVVGALLAALLRRILTAMRFDERFARSQTVASITNIRTGRPRHSPTVLLARPSSGDASCSASSSASPPSTPPTPQLVRDDLHPRGRTSPTRSARRPAARRQSRSPASCRARSSSAPSIAKLQYARFLSLGVKWLVLVLTAAMVLDHLEIGGTVVDLAFGILFGGIVLTLALAIGLGSRDLVSRSIEKSTERPPDAPTPLDPTPT